MLQGAGASENRALDVMSAPFSFSLLYSRSLWWAAGLAHLLPLLCLGASGVPGWARMVVLGGVLVSAGWGWRTARCLRHLRMAWSVSGEVWLRAPTGDAQIEILPDSIDLGWLIVLHWREMNSQSTGRAPLTRDALAPEHWRALRRYLRWSRPEAD